MHTTDPVSYTHLDVYKRQVPDDEQIVISTNRGEPLVDSDSLAGKAYMNICRRIMGEEVPFLDLNQRCV